jgi:hypothetical protein
MLLFHVGRTGRALPEQRRSADAMKIFSLYVLALIVMTVMGCNRAHDGAHDIVVGGLYASKGEDGTFRISKVLAVDESAVHVRIYKNKFPSLPQNLDLSTLSMGKLGDSDGFGIGHAPIAKEGWLTSHVFLKKEPVRDYELEGYNYYLEEMRKK